MSFRTAGDARAREGGRAPAASSRLCSRRDRASRAGFTLIELMIVVAIVGILASIAIPYYIAYTFRTKTSEARMLLSGIALAQQTFHAHHDNYANVTDATPAMPPGSTRRTWSVTPCSTQCNRTNTDACTSFTCISFAPASQLLYYSYASPHLAGIVGSSAEFGAGASGDLDGSGGRGGFAFRSGNSGPSGSVDDGISGCPANVPAFDLIDCAPGNR